MKAFQTFCRKELASLEELTETWDKQWEPPIEVPCIIVDGVRDRAAKLGLVELVRKAPKDASLDEARLFLAEALAACKPKEIEPGGSLTVEQAAKLLACKPKTVRKLVDRTRRGLPGGIRFHQVGRHSPICFRREWIDEFLTEHSHGVKRTVAHSKTKPLTYDEF